MGRRHAGAPSGGGRATSAWRGREVGVVFQFFQLLPTLTVAENVMLPMDFCHTHPPRERKRRALGLLGRVGVERQADKLPAALSGGEQQRAAIARALANDPPVVVADEPTGSLDSRATEAVLDLFSGLVEDGKTLVMVTHGTEALPRAGRVVELVDGGVASGGGPTSSRDGGDRERRG